MNLAQDPNAYHRLIQSLRLIAAPFDIQRPSLPDFVVLADEIALIFDEAYEHFCSTGGVLPADAASTAQGIDRIFEGLSGPTHAGFWEPESLRTAAQWEVIRSQARTALAQLGTPEDRPHIDWVSYVESAR